MYDADALTILSCNGLFNFCFFLCERERAQFCLYFTCFLFCNVIDETAHACAHSHARTHGHRLKDNKQIFMNDHMQRAIQIEPWPNNHGSTQSLRLYFMYRFASVRDTGTNL